ncbi:MAG: hypothetical protein JNL74_18790 [Fibrobacteres bacterium]|nr:hypothetical protein [Fibrobacterota bacterium]
MKENLSYFKIMNNKRLISILAISLVLVIPAKSDDAGVAGFDFLNIQPGSHPVSLAGAYTAGYGDAYSFAYNPAGLTGIKNRTFMFDYLHYVLDISRGMIGFAVPRKDTSGNQTVFGTYLNYLNAGSFEIADGDGNMTGETFSSGSYELGFSAAKDIPASLFGHPLQVGATVKGLFEQVSYQNWSAFALDAGVQYLVSGGRVRLGASARNIGLTFKEVDSFPLATSYSLGLSLTSRSWQNARFYTDYNYPVYGAASLRTGLDLRMNRDVYLRFGYRFLWSEVKHLYNIIAGKTESEAYARSDINNFAAGLGIRFARYYTLDLAVQTTTFERAPLISATMQYAWK